MKKVEYQARCEQMNKAILNWMLERNPSSAQVDYAMNKAQAVQYHWYYQVTDWDAIDLLAFSLLES